MVWRGSFICRVHPAGRGCGFNFAYLYYNKPIDVRKVDFYVQNLLVSKNNRANVKLPIYAGFENAMITVTMQDYSKVHVDVSDVLQTLMEKRAQNGQRNLSPVSVSGENAKYRVKLSLRTINGDAEGHKYIINHMSASAFITEK